MVTRYTASDAEPAENGGFVSYADYARLLEHYKTQRDLSVTFQTQRNERRAQFDFAEKQRDAAYAALDAVVALATQWQAEPMAGMDIVGDALAALLLKHGVHGTT